MTELDLFDELTFLEDDLILEAHEVPARKIIRFRGLRRVAVLVAAVMTVIALSLSAVAGDWDVTPMSIYEKYAEDGNSWRDIGRRGNCYGVRCQEFEYNETIYQLNHFFFNDTATTEIYTHAHTHSLHDALTILSLLDINPRRTKLKDLQ